MAKTNICPNCKDEFSDSTICGKCGYHLRMIVTEKATEFIEDCPFCGHKIYNSRICPNCGSKTIETAATIIENLAKQVKCQKCGATLERINGDCYRCNNCNKERENKMPDFTKAMTIKDNGKGTIKATQSKFQGMAVAINMNLEELSKIATELAGRLNPIMEKPCEEKAFLKKETIGDSEVLVWMTGVNESIEIIKGQLEEILERIEI